MSGDAPADEPTQGRPGGPWFWATAAIGAGIVGVGLRGIWMTTSAAHRPNTLRFVLGAGVAHDALWAPAAVVVGIVTAVVVPVWARLPVRLGLAFTALVVLVSWPEVRRYGARPRNPTILPLDYGRNLLVVLALVWAAVAVAVAISARRRVAR